MDLRSAIVVILISASGFGQTIKTRSVITQNPAPSNVENPDFGHDVYYRSGAMRRRDTVDREGRVSFSNIANCKTRTGFLIDVQGRQYRKYKLVTFSPSNQVREYAVKNHLKIVPIDSRTVDTGERKTILGHTAKHFVTTNKDGQGGVETIDGWYIDHDSADPECAPEYTKTDPYYVVPTTLVRYPDVPEFHHSGPLPSGLRVEWVHSSPEPAERGKAAGTITLKTIVESLSDAPIPPSTFELPSGFKENPKLLK